MEVFKLKKSNFKITVHRFLKTSLPLLIMAVSKRVSRLANLSYLSSFAVVYWFNAYTNLSINLISSTTCYSSNLTFGETE